MNRTTENRKLSVRDITYCGMFVAFMAIGAFIHIMLPVGPSGVTVSLQILFALLAGFVLGPQRGFLSVAAYLILGLCGLPIYAHGGGLGYILKPTYGFLIGFAAAAFVCGHLYRKRGRSLKSRLLAAFLGVMVYYACGLVYYFLMFNYVLGSGSIGIVELMSVWFLSSIVPDLVIGYAAAVLAGRIVPLFEQISRS